MLQTTRPDNRNADDTSAQTTENRQPITDNARSAYAALRHHAYAGNPAARIAKPIRLLTGDFTIVAMTTIQHEAVKIAVVTGCPGVRNPAAGWRRRKMNSARPVSPKKTKSVETT